MGTFQLRLAYFDQFTRIFEKTRAFNARFWPQILLKNKFWNLGEKTIPYNSHMSPLLETRTSTSFILQALQLQRPEEP